MTDDTNAAPKKKGRPSRTYARREPKRNLTDFDIFCGLAVMAMIVANPKAVAFALRKYIEHAQARSVTTEKDTPTMADRPQYASPHVIRIDAAKFRPYPPSVAALESAILLQVRRSPDNAFAGANGVADLILLPGWYAVLRRTGKGTQILGRVNVIIENMP